MSGCQLLHEPPPTSALSTLITKDGIKLFELALRAKKPIRLSVNETSHKDINTGISEKRVHHQLNVLLERTKYCREGYIILGRYAGETVHRVRGECRDRASEADYSAYPNTIDQW